MTATDKVKQKLMDYLSCVAQAGRIYGIRDFNSHVMMNAYAAEERDALGPALQTLLDEGILAPHSANEYVLTRAGLEITKRMHRTAAA